MKIKSVELKNFKRFTDLTVEEIPETAKLVIMTGPNGSGKSSFFEALNSWRKRKYGLTNDVIEHYLRKIFLNTGDSNNLYAGTEAIEIQFYDQEKASKDPRKAVYIRSAYRNQADFKLNSLSQVGSALEEKMTALLIHNEANVEANYRRLVSGAVDKLFNDEKISKKTVEEIRGDTLKEINDNLDKLFGDLKFTSFGDPLSNGTFKFDKGEAKNFEYQNLSGGEKAVFDLILDIIVKKKEFDDTVYCIDEPEAHLNSKVQGELLRVLVDMIPDNCQLWLATHSIGMMRAAFDLYKAQPEEIVFLDFGNRDFDKPQPISPIAPNIDFWRDMLELALDDLSKLVIPRQIIFCEGTPASKNSGGVNGFDATVYNKIFADEFPDVFFVSVGNKTDVAGENERSILLQPVIQEMASGVKIIKLIDRDNFTKEEINDKEKKGTKVLSKRSIENYLINEVVLKKFCDDIGQSNEVDKVIEALNEEITNSINEGQPPDNMKAVANKLYPVIKRILNLSQGGSDSQKFMRDILAPLITKDMEVYQILKNDIFGKGN